MKFLSKSTFVQNAANIATALFVFFIGAQLLLAAGVLPVAHFWGGRQTELTASLRVSSIVAVFILGAFIYIIRYRAGLLGKFPTPKAIRVGAWVVTAYMVLNTVGNFASVSATEKFLFGPMTILMALSCFVVAASKAQLVGES